MGRLLRHTPFARLLGAHGARGEKTARPQQPERALRVDPVVLEGAADASKERSARAAAILAAALPPMLLTWAFILFASSCMDTATFTCAFVCGTIAVVGLGATDMLLEKGERQKRPRPFALVCAAAAAMAATLALPWARMGFFALANGLIDHIDTAFSAYIPYVAGTATVAASPLFGACLGIAASVVAWVVAQMRWPAATLIAALAVGAANIRLGSGAAAPCCVFGIGAWIARCREAQLPGSTYSLRTFTANTAAAVAACVALFALTCAVYTPQAAVDVARSAIRSAWTEVRYGHDTLPEGDLASAAKMNTDVDGAGLTITYEGALSGDLYLSGFSGADFDGAAWSTLDHTAYEGEWHGMTSWLGEKGLVSSRQRSAFDDAAAAADQTSTPTATVEVDATRANRRYVYTPYTLRTLSGASLKESIEGSLAAGLFPSATYSETIDAPDKANILADTGWLAAAGATNAYAQAERVYAGFAQANYLAISNEESAAAQELLFTDDAWDADAATEYDVIARVRAMLGALATYSATPAEAATADGSFTRWFLGQAHAGNSSYFATAAVLAFRSQGIPARYVEGYRADAAKLASAGSGAATLTLTAADAHAWAEVYFAGIGWTPIEVTPGFYTQAVNAQQVIDVGEAWSNGNGDILGAATVDQPAGSEEVDAEKDDAATASDLLSHVLRLCAGLLFAVCLMAVLAFCQRTARIARRRRLTQADDQEICVPALYAYLSAVMRERGLGFNEDRPLDCAGDFDGAFTGIDSKEYRRAIELHQAFAFGGQTLRPNELRTLRRFNERLHAALPAPTSIRDSLRRRLVRAL